MHAYNRLPNSGPSSPSAPSSPRSRSPRLRSKPAPRFPGQSAPKTLPQHLASYFVSLLLRRQGIFLFAPLIYISAVLFYMDTLSFHNLPPPHYAPLGSIYRSPQLYANLRPEMESDNSTADAISTIWRNSYKGGEWRPCIDKSSRGLPESNGYIYIEANGGLNQQRTSICNAVAVAGYLNATLIIPHFHFHSIWRDPRIIRISPFANRLSFDAPTTVQRLRCLANYKALRFSNPILSLGQTLVARMKDRSANNSGKYISVHLRFEEVGLMLRGMGFGKSTSIYLASGKIYDSERHMKPLLEMFPLLQTKEMLTSPEELAPFQNYSSRMAAIDYTVCLHSEVFVTTQGGNFPHFLLGHRRFLYGGHSRTIRPDKRKLALLYDNPNIGWKSFKRQMLNIRTHSDSKGIEIKRPSDSLYSVPCPDCMRRSNKTEVLKSSSAA